MPEGDLATMDELKENGGAHVQAGGFMQDTPPRADVDEILRRKRKAREYKVRSVLGRGEWVWVRLR